MDEDQCPVCRNRETPGQQARIVSRGPHGGTVDCPACGAFRFTEEAWEDFLALDSRLSFLKRARLSHQLRVEQSSGENAPLLDVAYLERFLERDPRGPSRAQQAANLIRFIGDQVGETGQPMNPPPGLYAIIGSVRPDMAFELLQELVERGLVKGIVSRTIGSFQVSRLDLTLGGWEAYERERSGRTRHGPAIIAMKFNDPDLDAFVDGVVKPAVEEAGYLLERVSDRPIAGVIDQIMRIKLRDAPFVLADLTHDNPGAYWEAGFAEGLGKPVIYLCHHEKWDVARTHFDTNHCETVTWNADEAEKVRSRLVAVIRNSMVGRQ